MKIVTIDDAENVILGLQDEIRRSEESRYDHRLHGVLLVAHGMNCCQVADILGDAPRTVAYWVERFEQKGLGGLHEGSRSGRPSKLNAHQIADLQKVLRGKPSEVGLSGNLWDGKTMSAYLRSKHRVQLGPRQCRRLLREWDFRYREPKGWANCWQSGATRRSGNGVLRFTRVFPLSLSVPFPGCAWPVPVHRS